MKKYIVIYTQDDSENEYMHFVSTETDKFISDMLGALSSIYRRNEHIDNIKLSDDFLGAW